MKIGIIDLCKQIEDPRMNRKKVHKMETIIYISIAAVICGAQSWNEIEEFGNAKIAFFKSRIPGLEFIPSHDTFNRFFSMIKPDYFELIFRNWVKRVCLEVKGVVAIDGKLMRGPSQCDGEHTRGKEGFKLWMVSAWSAANGISLGQVKVDDKNNEITAIPLLINSLELSGCIVTIDAMGCQKDITQTIIEHDANYTYRTYQNAAERHTGVDLSERRTRRISERCRRPNGGNQPSAQPCWINPQNRYESSTGNPGYADRLARRYETPRPRGPFESVVRR